MKTKRFKTLLSLLLVLAMGLSLCGVSVFADEGDIEEPVKVEAYGDGTVTVNNDPAPAEPTREALHDLQRHGIIKTITRNLW